MNTIDILVLHGLKGVGNKSLMALLRFCAQKGLRALEDLEGVTLSNHPGLRRVAAALQPLQEDRSALEEARLRCRNELDEWRREGISVVSMADACYPKQLFALDEPPAILFCRGNLDLLETTRMIAIIGTRKNTPTGRIIAERTAAYFSASGFCIVSGLALGIDAIAHQAALDANGRTIAVLCDVLNISPAQNRQLAEKILLDGGLLIAENPPRTRVVPALFVKRDRIQAGLSVATFAIETSINGGTMHAVNASIAMRRNVYVPDINAAKYPNLDAPEISGIRKLIAEKAALVYSKESYVSLLDNLEREASRALVDETLKQEGSLL